MVEIQNTTKKKYKYDAFISYRHIEPDLTIAEILHDMIEKFNIPKHLRTVSNDGSLIDDKHVFRVFRDREELSTKDLSTMIEEAIANSENLIVICSKRTSFSPWCRKEVQLFKRIHGANNIIPVLIEGEPDESFIDELKNLKATFINSENVEEEKNIELLAADIRPDEVKSPSFKGYEILQNSKDPKLDELTKKSLDILKKSEIYRIVASMLNVNYGDLKLRHQERYLKRIIYTSVAASIAMLIFVVSVTTLYLKSVASERKANEQSSLMTLNMANEANLQGNRILGVLIAQEAMKNVSPKMEKYNKLEAQYENILNNSLITLPFSNQFILPTESETASFGISSDSKWLISSSSFNNAIIWDLDNGGIKKTLTFESPVVSIALSPDSKKSYVGTANNKIFEVNMEDYEIKNVFGNSTLPAVAMRISKNNKYLFALRNALILDVFDIQNQKKLYSFTFPIDNMITGFAENPQTNNFFILRKDNTITEYDINTGEVLIVHASTTNPNKNFFRKMTITDNGTLFYSDIQENTESFIMKNLQSGQINCASNIRNFSSNIVVNKDATLLYVSSLNNFITRFDLSNLKPDEEINVPQRVTYLDTKRTQYNESIKNMILSPDENTLAVVLNNMAVGAFSGIKNITSDSSPEFILNEKSTHKSSVDIIKFTPDSKKIVTSANDYTIRVMDTESTMGKSQLLNGKIVASSRDKNSILILSGDKISKYNFDTNKEEFIAILDPKFLKVFQQFSITNNVSLVALSDSTEGASASVFDVKQDKKIYTTKSHTVKAGILPFISGLQFSNDGNFLFTLGPDNQLFIHNAKTGEFLFSLEDKENGEATSFIMSNDDNFVAINYITKKSTIFSLREKKVVQKINGEVMAVDSENNNIKAIYGQVDSKLFVTKPNSKVLYYADNKIKTATGTLKYNTINMSYDGKYYISSIPKNNTIITDLVTGEPVRTFYNSNNDFFISLPVISKDNKKVAYSESKDKIIIMNMYSTEELSKMATKILKGRQLNELELNSIGRRE
ncbi:TIR domain-containing protein [Fusobacterium nucleatum subsp. nucleatum ATCC 23726]|uniref:WD domain, G-beta repeat protein n=1 Tax=Fusobacterium nucleatum subsp. nucleatum (strain ATCC 23726 / VPI 4351) TaxID=525283 RepID=D5RBL9_FUSN2|nr:TIR domain-containing protein [Fusobacterium nucleatum]AVQ23605.1 TIR domain-containing protein [Fusobacterium nucleatum subsp. nucleatum ATCC 23726]EFG95790.1 WD domain, G-beta repeat protein [Fusobacterium nucleatum subsp. nucleatum ATCC 23726]